MRHCHRLARETVGAPYLEELKARLDAVLGSLSWWGASLPTVGIGTEWALRSILTQAILLFSNSNKSR